METVSNDELYEHHSVEVEKKHDLIRIDKFLLLRIPNTSRTKIQKSISSGNVFCNNTVVKSNYKVKPLDKISIRFDYEKRFNEALDDDFNTPIALSILFEIAKHANTEREDDKDQAGALSELLKKLGNHIGIMGYDAEDYLKMGIELSDAKIDEKIRQRESARASKDFAMSDQIRDELLALGIILEDSINGTTWRRK